jgi:hypothetical protein
LILLRHNLCSLYLTRICLTWRTFEQLETRLRVLEGKELGRSASSTKGKPKIEVYEKDRKKGAGLITPAKVSSIMILSWEYSKDTSQIMGNKGQEYLYVLVGQQKEYPHYYFLRILTTCLFALLKTWQ